MLTVKVFKTSDEVHLNIFVSKRCFHLLKLKNQFI